MSEDTYSAELTFKEWMLVSVAVQTIGNRYRRNDDGDEAERHEAVVESLKDQIDKLPDTKDDG